MTLVRRLRRAIDSRALNQLNKITPTEIGYEAQEQAKVALAPIYMMEVPRVVSMVAYKLSQASTVYDFSQYKRKSTYLEVRYEDKYYYEKVNKLMKDLSLTEMLEEVI